MRSTAPSPAHVSSRIRRKAPHPTSDMARERLPFRTRLRTFRSSPTRPGLAFASAVVTWCRTSWRMVRMRRCTMRQAHHGLLVGAGEHGSRSLLPCLRIPRSSRLLLLPRALLRTALHQPHGLLQRLRGRDPRSIRPHGTRRQPHVDAHHILRPLDLPGLGIRALPRTGQAHEPTIRRSGDGRRADAGLRGRKELQEVIRPLLGADRADARELHVPGRDPWIQPVHLAVVSARAFVRVTRGTVARPSRQVRTARSRSRHVF
jgi:hypothetical protein